MEIKIIDRRNEKELGHCPSCLEKMVKKNIISIHVPPREEIPSFFLSLFYCSKGCRDFSGLVYFSDHKGDEGTSLLLPCHSQIEYAKTVSYHQKQTLAEKGNLPWFLTKSD